MTRRRRTLVALAAAGVVAVPLLSTSPAAVTAAPQPGVTECPPGQVLTTKTASQRRQERLSADPADQQLLAAVDAASAPFATTCRPVKAPEPMYEIAGSETQKALAASGPQGFTPPGALRAAIGARTALDSASEVPGAQGTFTPLGTTPLIGDVDGYDSVNGQGLADIAGRVDSLAYDEAGDRLFSAPGTGGVWTSTDRGTSWKSIGDDLPYQSVGAVDWTSAGGGTVLVLSGEASAGGGVYTGLGAYWSDDMGATWNQASGIPDGLMGFEIDVDPTNPSVAYAATSQGLFRSADAGRSYVNVDLPTSDDCAGVTGYDNKCFLANWVTDVEVQAPGGTTDAAGGQVIAAVGYRAGNKPLFDGTPSSPGNGLYRSATGAKGSFTFLDDIFAVDDLSPSGFAVQERIGRTELGSATGEDQDHGFLYAIVQDAKTFNGGLTTIDIADPTTQTGPIPNNTILNGVYVSSDFGSSWTRMADEVELGKSPLTESALIGTSQAMLYAPGVQAFYNMWIEPDPVGATAAGVPTRLVFGLEEVWESRLPGTAQDGLTQQVEPASFRVVGPYFADDTCLFLSLGLPTCPTSQTSAGGTTTHPDQQSGIFLPGEGGSVLVVGNDGGTYRQQLTDGAVVDKEAWGRGANAGYNTLLPYSAEVAKDGVVWMGLQDNGSAFIDKDGKQISTFGGDGTFVAVDPDDSKTAYISTPNNAMQVTTDGGLTFSDVAPPVTGAAFVAPFVMDPLDSAHLLTGGPEIVETTNGPTADWTEVYNVGEGATVSAVELQGENGYVGFCTTCDIINADPEVAVFKNGFATNVGGEWRTTAATGLPNRFITSIAADPTNPRTVFVTLGGYSGREWWPAGAFNDANPQIGTGHVFKSTNGGDSFTDISGSLPDVPATWVETNRGQLVIGTQIGVFLSSDKNGTKWAALEGLPAAPVSTIRTQPGNDSRLIVASYGRGVYSYTLSGRAAAPPVVTPGTGTPGTGTPPTARPPGGGLAATGLPIGVAALALLTLGTAFALRRGRQHS